jgi:propanol-preferring alcohol dehydrogenase
LSKRNKRNASPPMLWPSAVLRWPRKGDAMHAMVLNRIGEPLTWAERPDPAPGPGEIRVRVESCGVCRTDLHLIDGELPDPKLPVIPGHEIVGRVAAIGTGVAGLALGDRVGVPWLGRTCGACPYCIAQRENLCDRPSFTGYTRDGGYATSVVADARYAFALGASATQRPAESLAPLMCAGLIGWRALKMAGPGRQLGLYGFGAAAHLVAQVASWQGRTVYAFTRAGDLRTQAFARELQVDWAGDATDAPPRPLDAAIIFAPAGELVPMALRAVAKGGRVVCAGIHMSDIPGFAYNLLWGERQLLSVANLTRADGTEFLELAGRIGLVATATPYALAEANRALADLRAGRLEGAAVLIP